VCSLWQEIQLLVLKKLLSRICIQEYTFKIWWCISVVTNICSLLLSRYEILLQGGGRSLYILQQEVETVDQIQKLFPNFASIPIYNDEADPMVGWSVPQLWRADVTYAAMVVKVTQFIDNLVIAESLEALMQL